MKFTLTSQSKIIFRKNGIFWETIQFKQLKRNDIFKAIDYGVPFDFEKVEIWQALGDAYSADIKGKTVGIWNIDAEKVQ